MSIHEFNSEVTNVSSSLSPMAYNLTQNAEDAKDLVQDTIVKALVNRDKFTIGSNLKGWLYTIMRNIFINNYRKNVKRRGYESNTQKEYKVNWESQSLNNRGEGSLIMQEIEKALASIDYAIRHPFLLHFNGYKYEEIATEMKIPLGTVKSRIFFARKELQKLLRQS